MVLSVNEYLNFLSFLIIYCLDALELEYFLTFYSATEIYSSVNTHRMLYFNLIKHYLDRVRASAKKLILNSLCLENCIPESQAYDYV